MTIATPAGSRCRFWQAVRDGACDLQIGGRGRYRTVQHQQGGGRRGEGPAAPLDAKLLDQIGGFRDAGGVEQGDRQPGDDRALGDHIAGGARDRCHDGPFAAQQQVEQAALANIGAANQRDLGAIPNQLAGARAGDDGLEGSERDVEIGVDIGSGNLVVRKVGGGIEIGQQ